MIRGNKFQRNKQSKPKCFKMKQNASVFKEQSCSGARTWQLAMFNGEKPSDTDTEQPLFSPYKAAVTSAHYGQTKENKLNLHLIFMGTGITHHTHTHSHSAERRTRGFWLALTMPSHSSTCVEQADCSCTPAVAQQSP